MLYIAAMRLFFRGTIAITLFALTLFATGQSAPAPGQTASAAGQSAPATGQAVPDLQLRDLKGVAHKLEEYRGKPVVLNFWATWCVPCAAEMPLLNEMQERYRGKAVFLAASVDDDDMKPAIASFIKKHQGSRLTVMTGATLESLHDFGLQDVMPGTVFIDAEGNIADRLSGALKRSDLEERMRKLAGEPAPLSSAKNPRKNRSGK